MKTYDFIICGGGMAGLSLAYYLVNSSLNQKQILIIEPSDKDTNDRTWAFWEEGEGAFEPVVYRSWDKLNYYDTKGNLQVLETGEYRYKVIRGIDFYKFIKKEITKYSNVEWLKEKVESIIDTTEHVEVITDSGQVLQANYAFDSTYKLKLNAAENYNLLQHFKGVVIKTKQSAFNPDIPDMMNFGIAQIEDECRFMYILPHDSSTALIEFTIFSDNLLTQKQYDAELFKYIDNTLGLKNYEILEEEFGVIPMSDVPTNEFPSKHIVRIGTAGGYTNPATGYTFKNTQERLQLLVKQLESTDKPYIKRDWWQKRHLLYASVLLNVLLNKRYPIGDVFSQMYKRNSTQTVFRFLDGKSTFAEELKIMASTPIYHFGSAALATVGRNIGRLFR